MFEISSLSLLNKNAKFEKNNNATICTAEPGNDSFVVSIHLIRKKRLKCSSLSIVFHISINTGKVPNPINAKHA